MAFVRAAGYEFTPQEIGKLSEELTDDELDDVAGGTGPWSDYFR